MNNAQEILHFHAEFVIGELKKHGVIIQRYDSYSTNSIYLKLDYGAANSIRISDHKGKSGLSYRYNLLTCCPYAIRSKDEEGYIRYYYPMSEAVNLVNLILAERHMKIQQYGLKKYRKFMTINQAENKSKAGFWQQAVIV